MSGTEPGQPTGTPAVQEEKPKSRIPSAPADDRSFWLRQSLYSPSAPSMNMNGNVRSEGITLEQAIAAKKEADRLAAENQHQTDPELYRDDADAALEQLAHRRERSNTIPVYDRPLTKSPMGTPTMFSLAEVRAEQAALDERNAREAAQAGKNLDEQMRVASATDFARFEKKRKDISAPVAPKGKPESKTADPVKHQPVKKKPAGGKKPKKPTQTKSSNAVQMHFKYDEQTNELMTDLSDD